MRAMALTRPRPARWKLLIFAIPIYGFGAAAHVITQVAVHQGREV